MTPHSSDAKIWTYVPQPSTVSLFDRVVWPFTHVGRVRHFLRLAFRTPRDQKCVDALVAGLRKLQRGRLNATREVLIADSLVFLAWVALEQGALGKARNWLLELQTLGFSSPPLIPLRWRLMEALFASGAEDGYIDEAGVLLSDPLVTWNNYSALILAMVRKVYEDLSPAACANLLSHRNEDLKSIRQLETIEAVCQGSIGFESREVANRWATTIKHGANDLAFSLCIQADALLGLSRVAEWNGDWEAMAFYAGQACRVLPDYSRARYWDWRALLHIPDSRSRFPADIPADSEGWVRLRLMYQLDENPNFDDAAALLDASIRDSDLPDQPEKLLIAELIARSLASPQVLDTAQLMRRAEIAEILRQRIGRFPWAEVYIAWKLVCHDRRYEEARERLEVEDVAEVPGAQPLARIARIMLGIPSYPKSSPDQWGALELLEFGLLSLVVAASPQPASANKLPAWSDLFAARKDALFDQYPDLRPVADALAWALGAITQDPASLRSDFLDFKLPLTVPAWVRWIFSRTALVLCDPSNPDPFIAKIDTSERTCWWELERWTSNESAVSSISDGKMHAILAGAASIAGAKMPVQVVTEDTHYTASIHELRSQRYRASIRSSRPKIMTTSLFPELGKLCDRVCTTEVVLELDYGTARFELADGNAEGALAALRKVEESIRAASSLTVAAWLPIVRYWIGVACARLGREDSAEIFASLANGFKGLDARAQLAVLAIQKNDLDSAEHWLDGIPSRTPSSLYAHALLAERQGDTNRARQLAESFQMVFPDAPQPYAQAARRLIAALAERCGNTGEAIAMHSAILATDPADSISSARLSRLLLEQEYDGLRSGDGQIAVVNPYEVAAQAISWSGAFALLRRGLICPLEEIDDWFLDVSTHPFMAALLDQPAWSQILVRRLLEAGRTGDSLSTIRMSTAETNPGWRRRARMILEAWELIVDAGKVSAKVEAMQLDRLRRHLDWMELIPEAERDDLIRRWTELLRQTIRLLESGPAVVLGTWDALAPWPMAWVPALWSPQAEERARAAAALAPMIADHPGWSDRQRKLLRVLCAWTSGRSDEFLDAYAALEPDLDGLPVPGASLWVAAASLWFRQDRWDKLIEGEMPDCVADLADPRVRLIVGLAYARSAIEDTKRNNARRALQRIQQARGTLQELLP